MRRSRAARSLLFACALGACAPPASQPPATPRAARGGPLAPVADSLTIGLWRLDETGESRVADDGPNRLTGTAGADTRTDFGRFHGARIFQRSTQSFVHVPYGPALESPEALTIEAWVNLNHTAPYELQTIASRWTNAPGGQSWVFGVTGERLGFPAVNTDSPGWFSPITEGIAPGRLVFVFQPAVAAAPRAFASSQPLPLQRWVHVAATFDAQGVQLWIDGLPDAQYATGQAIRESSAPLELGVTFDPRRLSTFGGELHVDDGLQTPLVFYAFDGGIDELRLSGAARTSFEGRDRR